MPQVDGKQIKTGSIAEATLASAYTADVLKRDGSVAMTADFDAGSQKIVSLGAPTAAGDAARLQDVQNIPWKEAARCASTANLGLTGLAAIDGVTPIANDRVLAKDQSTGAENGVYIAAAGAWSRAADFDSTAEVEGAVVSVAEGTANADKRYAQTTDNVVVDTTAMVFVDIGGSGSPAYPNKSNKAMVGVVTSSDFDKATNTTIATTPAGDGYVGVRVNGVSMEVGDGVKTKDCYFSSDTGTTAKAMADIASGDELFWVGTVAGFEIATTDRIDAIYTS